MVLQIIEGKQKQYKLITTGYVPFFVFLFDFLFVFLFPFLEYERRLAARGRYPINVERLALTAPTNQDRIKIFSIQTGYYNKKQQQ